MKLIRSFERESAGGGSAARALAALVIPALALLAHVAPSSAQAPPSFDGTIWVNDRGSPGPGIRHETFASQAMKRDIGYNIYLPPDYHSNARRYPVVYFLHGMGGDENSDATSLDGLIASGEIAPMIAVFPNGGKNSKYMDAAPGSRMHGVVMIETALVRELVPHIDTKYRTVADRSGRMIAGFSMGGMGALRLAFKYPAVFGAVSALSPAVLTYAYNIREISPDVLAAMFRGDPDLWTPNTALALSKRNARHIRGRVPIFMSIGEEDTLLPWVNHFSENLTRHQLMHEFRIVPGRHHTPVLAEALTQATLYFAQRSPTRVTNAKLKSGIQP